MRAGEGDGKLRVLFLEDKPADAELMERALRAEQVPYTALRVQTKKDLLDALERFKPDVMIADYHLPGFDGVTALQLTRELIEDMPFIFVTGSADELTVAQTLLMGATDYILKDRLPRLVPAIHRAVRERRERAERAEMAARYRDLVASVPVGLYRSTPDGKILSANPALANLLGFPNVASVLAANANSLYEEPAARERWKTEIEERGMIANRELRHVRPDGTKIWVRDSARVMRDGEGVAVFYDGVLQDITEERSAREETQAQAALLRTGEALANVGSWEFDIKTGKTKWSDQLYRIFGLEPGSMEPSLEAFTSHVHPDDRAEAALAAQQLLASGSPVSQESRILRKDGSVRVLHSENHVAFDEGGVPTKAFGIAHDVTERHATEEALRESEARLAEAQRMAHIGSWDWDMVSDRVEWSDELFPIFGVDKESFGGNLAAVVERIHPDDRVMVSDMIDRSRDTGEPAHWTMRVVHLAGEIRHLDCASLITLDGQGEALRMFGTCHDVTDRIRAEEKLRLRALQSAGVAKLGSLALSGLTFSDLLARSVELVSSTLAVDFVKVFELLPDGKLLMLAGDGWEDNIIGSLLVESGDRSQSGYTLAAGEPIIVTDMEAEGRFDVAGYLEEHAIVSSVTVPIQGASGWYGTLGACSQTPRVFTEDDIHFLQALANVVGEAMRRFDAEEELREANEALETVMSSSPVPILTTDSEQLITRWNPAAERTFGWLAEEVLGKPTPLVPPPGEQQFAHYFAALMAGGILSEERVTRVRKDGSPIDISVSAAPLRSASGEITGTVGLLTDISERRKAEEQIEFQASVLDQIRNAVIVTDLQGTITYWNHHAERLYGWMAEEALGRPITAIVPFESEGDGDEIVEETVQGGTHEREITVHRKDGSTFPVHLVTTAIHNEDGDLRGIVGISTDITDRRLAESELSDSMAVLRKTDQERRHLLTRVVSAEEQERGRIASDIHDDSIQVMTATSLRIGVLKRHLEGEALASAERLETAVHDSISRLRRLMFELRPAELDRDGLAAAIQLYMDFTTEDNGPDHFVEDRLKSEPPSDVRAILYRIAQEALTNVRKHARASAVSILLEDEEDGCRVRIKDDGVGFHPEDVGPRPGHLGLAAMRERAEMAGGRVLVSSIIDHGTVIDVWVPSGRALSRLAPNELATT